MFAETPVHEAFGLVANYFDAVGVLAQRKLVDIDLVSDMWGPGVNMVWQKLKPLAEGMRKEYKSQLFLAPLEHLYNEIQKIENKN